MKKILLGLCCLWLFATSAVEAQVPEGTVIRGSLQIGSRSFALPPGDWTVLASDEAPLTVDGVSRRGTYRRVYVAQIDASNHFVAAILYRATTSSLAGLYNWAAEPCKRTDTLYRDPLDGNVRFPACLLVNHTTNFMNGQTQRNEFDLKIFTWFENRKIELPYTVIDSGYAKYTSGDFATARVWMNPDVTGIDPGPRGSWQNSPWHPRLIAKDPQRVAYIEQVKAWDSVLVASVKESLMGSQTASIALPPLPGSK